jgi:hypothetical protein
MSIKNDHRAKLTPTVTIQLPIQSNDYGIPCVEDFLAEVQRHFDVEKNIKNNLYAFILDRGLFNELKDYSRSHDMSSPDGHKRTVDNIVLNVLPEFKN